MRRLLPWLLVVIALVALPPVLLVLSAEDVVPLPTPDARLPIELPDGTVVELGAWLVRAAPEADRAALADVEALFPGTPWGPVFKLGEHRRHAGRLDQALALFQSIPRDDPDYAIARRRIALELADRGEGVTAVGLAKQSLAADPFCVNGWQDLVRVFGAKVGFGFN